MLKFNISIVVYAVAREKQGCTETVPRRRLEHIYYFCFVIKCMSVTVYLIQWALINSLGQTS